MGVATWESSSLGELSFGELQCGGVAMWRKLRRGGSCGVRELWGDLRFVGVIVRGCHGTGWQCGAVAVWGDCGVGELQREGVAVWGRCSVEEM